MDNCHHIRTWTSTGAWSYGFCIKCNLLFHKTQSIKERIIELKDLPDKLWFWYYNLRKI